MLLPGVGRDAAYIAEQIAARGAAARRTGVRSTIVRG